MLYGVLGSQGRKFEVGWGVAGGCGRCSRGCCIFFLFWVVWSCRARCHGKHRTGGRCCRKKLLETIGSRGVWAGVDRSVLCRDCVSLTQTCLTQLVLACVFFFGMPDALYMYIATFLEHIVRKVFGLEATSKGCHCFNLE